jgi:23S rRNA pseudouridine955/2504/2580 synthase
MIEILVETNSSMRLDKYLRNIYPSLTQGMIEKALRKKDIIIKDSPKTTASDRVAMGDTILVYPGLVNNLEQIEEVKYDNETKKLAEFILKKILFENDDVLVINKPNGIAAQGGTGIIASLDNALKYINNEYRLTHRIDRETSGIILIAKHREAAVKLTEAFAQQKIKKKYEATLVGIPKQKYGRIESYISKKSLSANVQKVVEDAEHGRIAITEYEVVKKMNGKCKVIFTPLTGRMHQLRFHATQLGCYIEGDKKYGPELLKFSRLKLHASYMKVPEEVMGYVVEVSTAS